MGLPFTRSHRVVRVPGIDALGDLPGMAVMCFAVNLVGWDDPLQVNPIAARP